MHERLLTAPKTRLRARLRRLAGGFMIFTGLGLVTAQIYYFIKSGWWIELPVSYLTVLGPEAFVAWLDKPGSFILLHWVVFHTLNAVPIPLLSFLLGWLLLRATGQPTKPGPRSRGVLSRNSDSR